MLRIAILMVTLSTASACSSALSEELRGHYYWGHEVESFIACGSEQPFWVVGEDSLLQPLRDRAETVRIDLGQPYQPIYIEASALSEGKAEDGFAADYDGVYRLTSVHSVHAESPKECASHG